jgi:uncharacterized protein YndB with AHSA1/START domain
MRHALSTILLLAAATPAMADVRTSGAPGFEIEQQIETRLEPRRLYQLLTDVPAWWLDSHTYSGKSANLSLAAQPGGCWCEKMPDGGGIEHMRVVQVVPGRRLVLSGSLGPLLGEATSGVMQWTVAPTARGSSLVLNYRVAGFYKGDGARLAVIVDQVLGAQVTSLQKAAERLEVRR